ncbi:PREDICTED: uncharacterized protein LOC104575983 [Tinamus guttatus]|uniref:uncharacterized protein LOC104575983 n=1 Tax=Tinamus guttatus TaxID=94827 RepID=UPI00052EE391|nr:PREDICTED: uncharacterized protein LOC104575983 [Tinamus guttatus]
MTKAFKKYQDSVATSYEQLDRRVAELVTRMDVLEARPPPPTPAPSHSPVDDDDDIYAPLRQRLARNRQGMGGNGRRRHHNPEPDHDPFAKIKFSIPPFMGSYDAEAYLDWEMTVEQKFNSHLVPEQHRVRQATSEFRDFAIIWWNELVNTRAAPQTWNALKEEMRARFVPPSYRRDLRKKLQRLDQGDMSVQEYYQELQKGMLRCGVVEDPEDQMVRFYGGLRREIQDIVDYKEYHSIQRLFHLSMLAEKELQGRQQRRSSTFAPRQPPAPAKVSSCSDVRTSTSSSTSSTRSTAPSVSQGHDNSNMDSSDIKCHRCQGLGHIQRDCPSKRAYIATGDGGYVSASDVEDEDTVGANIAETYDGDEEVLGTTATETYKALIVQRALSATSSDDDDNRQRHNLFNMFLIVKDCRVHTIIDGGSCNNLVNVEVVKKLGLTTREHPHPYHIQWFNNSGKFKVTKTARVHFSIGSYHDFADFDVVSMDACSLLLGRPWEFDTDAIHHGRSNKYTFMHKGKKIVLLPMTPTEMVHFEHEKKTNAKQKDLKPYMGDEDEIESRTTPIQEEEDDEDITSIHTMNGPITRSRARQLNLQDQSALKWTPKMHPDSDCDGLDMVGKIRRLSNQPNWFHPKIRPESTGIVETRISLRGEVIRVSRVITNGAVV